MLHSLRFWDPRLRVGQTYWIVRMLRAWPDYVIEADHHVRLRQDRGWQPMAARLQRKFQLFLSGFPRFCIQ